ncbi:MAG: aminotransferase class III-fold pyridoxal phosphate-dependent enzyme [Acidimicrobiales bacterium]|jgi:adenosylmethionine-8-amino-7-oxononanoate aminotransferase|nr:aspartate aminotransferase family protein [Acidimicrobiaceae bacterium]MDP6322940.1 aminotransferase class III-fold pyridoxal phosphate-dependent enzyme [Acidimicrobiales bacterium]MDP6895330.1 aminotransferase class III-fold pyridoxal phosphate-dependent enzyme [Acidimicrobiales bacterium]HJM37446.1 aminotransferase class III-fold pyridoxal phosphate-dependent enzyme [Acidimicrobiales bacterium]|tara:strand:+ start:885 stop:2114 length:1230 start_codon:yes stop_codon:yes gene_type:complete
MIPALLHAFSKPTSEDFHTLVRSEGVRVWDNKGNEYIDGLGGLWYCQIGHGRPELIEAITEQLQKMSSYHTFAPMGSDVSDAAAERIRSVSPFPDGRVFLCCSGSESIDTAIKILRKIPILRKQPERQIILRRGRGYHGVNIGGTTMQGIPANREGWGDLFPNVIEIDPTNIESAASIFAQYGEQIAGVVTEPLQGAGGVFPPQPGYLEGLRRLCDDYGALLVFDEVITGFGRTGNWFASDTYGVKPDIITFAKGVTSGYQPLGGVLISRTVCDVLESDPDFIFMHGYTYSGHPAASAAAIANINIIEDEGLVQRAEIVGDRLSGGLKALEKDGIFSEVRGVGAIWAAQITDASTEQGLVIRDKMTEMGVICRAINGALAFCPPLVIEENDIDLIVDTAAKAVEEVAEK